MAAFRAPPFYTNLAFPVVSNKKKKPNTLWPLNSRRLSLTNNTFANYDTFLNATLVSFDVIIVTHDVSFIYKETT